MEPWINFIKQVGIRTIIRQWEQHHKTTVYNALVNKIQYLYERIKSKNISKEEVHDRVNELELGKAKLKFYNVFTNTLKKVENNYDTEN